MSFRSIAIMLLLLVATACSSEPSKQSVARSANCLSRDGGSRWAGEYARTTSYGGDGESLIEVGGIVAVDSRVFVYDAPRARVTVLTDSLSRVQQFGRRGQGPGELHPVMDFGMRGKNWRWLTTAGDTLVVFDAIRVQQFDSSGRFMRQAFSELIGRAMLSDMAERIVAGPGVLVSTEGGYHAPLTPDGGDPNQWYVVARSDGRNRRLISLHLPKLPPGPQKVGFIGPGQARPLWDAAGGCVVASDGASAWLVRASLQGGRSDTIPVALPDVKEPRIDREELQRLAGGRYVEPSARRRVSGLIIDPDGYAWLLPWQGSTNVPGDVEIVRVSLATGRSELDTVPAFPSAFGRPGVYYATTNDRLNEDAVVTRFDMTASPVRTGGGQN